MFLFLSLVVACFALSVEATENFVLPTVFKGLWKGAPDYAVLGPFAPNTFEFAITEAPNGDYLFEDNLLYDDVMIGYQRFYVEGSGDTSGTLWYCGNLNNFSNSAELATTDSFKPYVFPKSTDLNVTFCLDSDSDIVMNPYNPFKSGCSHCDCANWTLVYVPSSDTLQLQMTMSGATEGSYHLWATLNRIGDAPTITDNDVAGHGANFSCDFNEGGRDSEPVVFPDNVILKDNLLSSSESVTLKPPPAGCPFMAKQMLKSGFKNPHITEDSLFDHCYYLNKEVGYELEWTLDSVNSLLSVSISAQVSNNSWIALGFRPLSRDFTVKSNKEGTGHHMNFGMEGADIVAGSTSGAIRLLYAELYTGAPVPSDSLQIYNQSVTYEDGTLTLSFTRDLVGGHVYANFNNNASIVSGSADIIWGIGSDLIDSTVEGGQCDYHFNTRGLRVIDWEHPEIAMADAWKC